MRPPTFARAPGILFIFLSSHEFLLLVKIRKTPETENDKNEKDPTTYETQTFPEPGRELRDEVVRETGGRTGASGSVMKSFKNGFYYILLIYCVWGVINTSWCALEVRGQFAEPLFSFHHACLPSG